MLVGIETKRIVTFHGFVVVIVGISIGPLVKSSLTLIERGLKKNREREREK